MNTLPTHNVTFLSSHDLKPFASMRLCESAYWISSINSLYVINHYEYQYIIKKRKKCVQNLDLLLQKSTCFSKTKCMACDITLV